MLTRREVREMRDLVQRLNREPGSPDDWSNLAALTLVHEGDATVLAIAANGYEKFVETVAPIYERHEFRPDDYARIYARVCEAATRVDRSERVQ